MNQPFGHRPPAKAAQRTPLPAMAKFARPAATPPPARPAGPSVEDEIREWQKVRGSHFPVKLLAFVASASFGIASLALPDGVNHWLQYPLFALSAASLYLGFARRKPKTASNAHPEKDALPP